MCVTLHEINYFRQPRITINESSDKWPELRWIPYTVLMYFIFLTIKKLREIQVFPSVGYPHYLVDMLFHNNCVLARLISILFMRFMLLTGILHNMVFTFSLNATNQSTKLAKSNQLLNSCLSSKYSRIRLKRQSA